MYFLNHSQEPIRLDDLEDILFVSRSTILNDVKKVKEDFSEWNIQLNNRPNYGLVISGNEFDYRMCLASIIGDSIDLIDSKRNLINSEKTRSLILQIVTRVFSDVMYYLSDVALNNIVNHICIAILRTTEGNTVDLFDRFGS